MILICLGLSLLFRSLIFDCFLSSLHLLCWKEGKLHYPSEKIDSHDKRDRFPISKMEFNYQISQLNEEFLPVFSNWVNFIKKCQVNLEIQRVLRPSICFLGNLRFQKTSLFFYVYLHSLTLFHLSVGFVCYLHSSLGSFLSNIFKYIFSISLFL